jgi:hypothetical protein
MGFDASLTSQATLTASLYASASITAGYQYSKSTSPQLQQISKNSISHGGEGLKLDKLCESTATASFSITPMAQVIVSFIGGPVSYVYRYIILHMVCRVNEITITHLFVTYYLEYCLEGDY